MNNVQDRNIDLLISIENIQEASLDAEMGVLMALGKEYAKVGMLLEYANEDVIDEYDIIQESVLFTESSHSLKHNLKNAKSAEEAKAVVDAHLRKREAQIRAEQDEKKTEREEKEAKAAAKAEKKQEKADMKVEKKAEKDAKKAKEKAANPNESKIRKFFRTIKNAIINFFKRLFGHKKKEDEKLKEAAAKADPSAVKKGEIAAKHILKDSPDKVEELVKKAAKVRAQVAKNKNGSENDDTPTSYVDPSYMFGAFTMKYNAKEDAFEVKEKNTSSGSSSNGGSSSQKLTPSTTCTALVKPGKGDIAIVTGDSYYVDTKALFDQWIKGMCDYYRRTIGTSKGNKSHMLETGKHFVPPVVVKSQGNANIFTSKKSLSAFVDEFARSEEDRDSIIKDINEFFEAIEVGFSDSEANELISQTPAIVETLGGAGKVTRLSSEAIEACDFLTCFYENLGKIMEAQKITSYEELKKYILSQGAA